MAKGSLSNSLIGKPVQPKEEYGDPRNKGDVNAGVWAGMKPNTAGQYYAVIEAAWIDGDGNVKILMIDPFGNSKETWMTHVQVRQF